MQAVSAAARRSVEDLRELLSREASLVEATDEGGQTALHVLASLPDCSVECIALLLRLGADVKAVDRHGWTALHCAARHGSLIVVDNLVTAGASGETKNSEGTTPLHYLARRAEEEHLGRIVEKFPAAALSSVNLALETPLHLAASHDGCVSLLIRLGADVNALNRKGESPLHYAARSGRTAAAAALLEAGARMESGDFGSPLQVAEKTVPELVQLLAAASQRPLNASLRLSGAPKARPSQRRVEQLMGVACRGLSRVAVRATLTIHWSREGPAVAVEQNELSSCNPEWEIDGGVLVRGKDGRSEESLVQRQTEMWICVWSEEESGVVLVLKRFVKLSELVYVGHELTETRVRFPPCTLVIELADGFYVDEESAATMRVGGHLPTVAPPKQMVAESYSLSEFVTLLQLAQHHKESCAERNELQAALDCQLLQAAPVAAAVESREVRLMALKARRAQLQEQIAQQKEDATKKMTEALCGEVLRGRLWIGNAQTTMEENFRSKLPELSEQRRGMAEGTSTLLSSMLAQLRNIFPVAQLPQGGGWTIAGLKLPNSEFAGCDQEQIATALGYVCHVVHIVARWLGVTLTYDTLPMSSRSIVRDEISVQGSGSSKFPLYSRGVDRTRFEYGVFLLNKDIEQLLHARGIEALPLKHTLPNLHRLMNMTC